MTRRKRILHVGTIDRTMEALGRAREACTGICREAPIHGSHYQAAQAVMSAIDGFAEIVTGDGAHFHARVSPAPAPGRDPSEPRDP